EMVDAFFDGDQTDERRGWVVMLANAKGRELIEGLFPNVGIAWRPEDRSGANFNPPGFRAFEIHVPGLVEQLPETNLPLDVIPPGETINDASGDGCATLLALGVRRAGGRAAIIHHDGKGPDNIGVD